MEKGNQDFFKFFFDRQKKPENLKLISSVQQESITLPEVDLVHGCTW